MASSVTLTLNKISVGNQIVITGPATGASLQVVTNPINVTASQLVVTSEPTYTQATATAGPLTSTGGVGPITVTSPGSGYFTTPPSVTFSGGGLPAVSATGVATLNASGQVTAVTVTGVSAITATGGGTGYSPTNPPQVSIPAPTGTTNPIPATATVVINPNTGAITGFVITNPGNGYVTVPSPITLSGGSARPPRRRGSRRPSPRPASATPRRRT